MDRTCRSQWRIPTAGKLPTGQPAPVATSSVRHGARGGDCSLIPLQPRTLNHLDHQPRFELQEEESPNRREMMKYIDMAMNDERVVLKPLHRADDDQGSQECPKDGL